MYTPFQVFALRCIAGAQLWQAVVAVACCKRQTGASNSNSIDYLPRTGLCLSSSSSSSSSSSLSIFPTLHCCCTLSLCVCMCVCNVVCNFCLRFLSSRLFCCCVSDTQRQQLQLHLLRFCCTSHSRQQQQQEEEAAQQKNHWKFSGNFQIRFSSLPRFAQSLWSELWTVKAN